MWRYKDDNRDKVKRDLEDYYGTAMFNGFPMAMMDLEKVKKASDNELYKMADDIGIYQSKKRKY